MSAAAVPAEVAQAQLDHELDLVSEAIALVAGGASPRVVVAGLAFGERLLELARRIAEPSGVTVVALPSGQQRGPDIAVERAPGG